eukprot:gene3309-48880_t
MASTESDVGPPASVSLLSVRDVWRGVRGAPADAVAEGYTQLGGRDTTVSSFSANEHVARWQDGGSVMRLSLSAGSSGASDINIFSAFFDPDVPPEKDEKELVFPPDLRMTVVSGAVADVEGIRVLHLVEQSAIQDTFRRQQQQRDNLRSLDGGGGAARGRAARGAELSARMRQLNRDAGSGAQ